MSKNLELLVELSLMDKLTAPLKSATSKVEKLSSVLKKNKDTLKQLNDTQNKMASFKRMSENIAKYGENIKKQTKHLDNLNNKINTMKNKRIDLKVNIKEKERELKSHLMRNGGFLGPRGMGIDMEISKLQREYEKLGATLSKTKQKFTAENKALKNSRTEKAKQLLVFRQLRKQLKESGIDVKQFANSELRLADKIAKANKLIDQQKAKLEKLNKVRARNERYQARVTNIKNISDRAKKYGQQSIITATSMGFIGKNLLESGVEFEKSFSKVKALTRLDKVKDADRIKALRDQAIQLGAETAFTSAEVADAQGYLAMAGFNDKQIISATPSMLQMSMASGADLARVADVASDISSGFKIQADNMGRVADVLTLTFTTSNTSLETLYETMKEGAPIATAAGQSFESTAALAGLLGNVGIKGSQAGTTLKNMFVRLSAPPKEAQKALDKLGVSTKDAKGNLKDVPIILKEIMQKTQKMGTAQRLGYFDDIFGKIGLAGASELVTQADGVIQNYENMLKDAKGTVEKVSATMTDNVAGDLKTLQSAKEALGLSAFDIISKDLREFIGGLTQGLRWINQWVKSNPELTAKLLKVASAIMLVTGGLGMLSLILGYIIYPVARTVLGLGHLIALFGKAALVIGKTGGFMSKFSLILLKNPIFLIVAAIVGLIAVIYLLWKNWDKVKNWLSNSWTELSNKYSDNIIVKAINGIIYVMNNWQSIVDTVTSAIKGKFEDLKNTITQLWDSVSQSITNAFNSAMEFLGLDTRINSVSEGVQKVSTTIIPKEHAEQIRKTGEESNYMYDPNYTPPTKKLEGKWTGGLVGNKVFATGGYTGNGGKYTPMGIVHGGEYVMTKEATSRLGVPLLNALNYGKNALLATGLGIGVATAQPIHVDNRPPLSHKAATMAATTAPMQVTITINGTNQRPEDIASAIRRELTRLENQRQAKARSSYRDSD